MKKLFSAIILFVFALHCVGTYPVFSVYQRILKREMRRFLEQHYSELNFELLEFKLINGRQHEFEILENGKEIRHHNVMYDVVKKQINENETIFFCIKDKRETGLLQNFRNVLLTNFSSFPVSHRAAMVLTQLFSQNYLPAEICKLISSPFESANNYFSYNEISSLFSPEKYSPPPELTA